MTTAISSKYEFTVILPDTFVFDVLCDNMLLTCDNDWTVDYMFAFFTKREAIIPNYSFIYILPELKYLSCDNIAITCDNLITVDNN